MKILILLFINLAPFAASSDSYLNELKSSSSILGKAMEIDGVKQIYQNCFNYYQEENNGIIEAEKIVNCVWAGNVNAKIIGVSDNKDLANKVNELVKKDTLGNDVLDSRFVHEGQKKDTNYKTGEHTKAVSDLENQNKAFSA